MIERGNSNTRISLLALILMLAYTRPAAAGTIDVVVAGPDGAPVPEVAVFVVQNGVDARSATTPGTATMDQIDKRFVPHILVVQKGTVVDFPNSDVTAHHVYSFSKPNNFVLPLYKGDAHDPITFDHDGIITLGCNIHDHMLSYIVIVDTDVFGVTDANGRVKLKVDETATDFAVSIWSPRIRDSKEPLTQTMPNTSSSNTEITFALQKKLRAPHNEQSDAVEWSEY